MTTMLRDLTVLTVLLGASACASDPARSAAARPMESAAPIPAADDALDRKTAAPARSAEELALWHDPAFRRRLAESYVAETDVEPRIDTSEREWLEKALDAISKSRLDEAARVLESQRGDGSNAVFDYMLANLHLQRDELDAAAPLYRLAVEKHPKFRRAWQQLGLVEVKRNEHAAARAALTRVIELGGGDTVTFGLLGFAHQSLGADMEAETAYRMASLLDPATLDWKMGLARSLFQQRRFADAIALCDGLLAADPDRPELWLLQANAFIGLGQPLRAAENYELVERLGASTQDSLLVLGDVYVNEGMPDLAVRAYTAALERHPDADVERVLRAAKVMSASGAPAETGALVAAIERARSDALTESQRKELLRIRARLAVAAGAGAEEVSVLEEIVALDPLDGEALLLLGQHAGRANDPETAIFYYERAAGIEAFEADAKVRHAQLLASQQRYADALPLLRRAQTLKPRENVQEYLEEIERRVGLGTRPGA
jgi:tetratricopeptide (TPR) repeat protein